MTPKVRDHRIRAWCRAHKREHDARVAGVVYGNLAALAALPALVDNAGEAWERLPAAARAAVRDPREA